MSRKKLTKTIWFGSEVDITGQPILPPIADNSNDLNGLHEGELYLHNADEMPSIWVRTKSGLIKSVTGSGNTPSFWELKTTDNGFNYLYTKLPIVTQYGVTMYKGESINLPSIYDGLPIDHDTIYWENGILKSKGGGSVDEGAVKEIIESYGYTTEDWVRDYVSENATGGIESITKQMVIEALGFTPYSAENPNGYITAASIPSALKNPYALTFGSKTYDGSSAKEITASDLGAALSSDLSKYLQKSGGTVSNATTTPLTINSTITEANLQVSVGGSGKALFGYKTGVGVWMRDSKAYNLVIGDDGILKYGLNNTLNTVWHAGNFNPANYLPLSGGTISGKLIITHSDYDDILTIKRIHQSGNSIIKYSNKTEFLGHIGVYGSAGTFPYHPMFADKDGNQYKIWHSGNDGSGSGLDADTLDGEHASKLYQVNSAVDLGGTTANYDTLIVRYSNASATSNHPYSIVGGNQCVALNLYAGTDYAAQLAVGFGNNYLAYRRKVGSVSWQSWVKINAGLADEATKLQTARTIWGQSFDGSGNVSGDLSGVGRIIRTEPSAVDMDWAGNFIFKNLNSVASNYWHIDTSDGTSIFVVHNNGNVGIGTTSPSAKLHVVGNILATGGVTMQSQRSLKNVIDERGLSLTELSAIKPTRYTWKDKRDDRIHFGGIADDIEKVLPEVIYTASDGTLTMDYGNAGFAIASSLIKPVIDHEERIKALERENKELKERLNRYEA